MPIRPRAKPCRSRRALVSNVPDHDAPRQKQGRADADFCDQDFNHGDASLVADLLSDFLGQGAPVGSIVRRHRRAGNARAPGERQEDEDCAEDVHGLSLSK